ncbi:anhydro-N-acetylmuramic acid kinase [Sulfurimonas sp. SAG-AH-194-I05]|nr:anhydro-N-acetylmuramic acid kinase [Sulfurimonas sp. SAG-AH-194-I05]MDF1874832.1 anhydro-N-acetylmuramic acid kinase [Sulfurimonas sp. SAG-AH-194-I05]
MKDLFIGVMSGTSLDGIDVTLCKISTSTCELIHAKEYLFNTDIKKEILHLISTTTTLQEIGTLNAKLGTLFAEAINTFIDIYSVDKQDIKAIGLHGQTLWHEPNASYPFSMQLGCPNVVHAQTNIQVIADFRSMDIANGGQGAPFAPAFHEFIFKSFKNKIAVLNIGGMANITLLQNPLRGWDTGVGNALMDYWVQECKNFSYDKDGAFARLGKVHVKLLENFLSDPYFKQSAPKSTGREYFNAQWLQKHLAAFKSVTNEDAQRTLLELTAQSITQEIKNTDIDTLIVCGGGAKNTFLMQRLQELCKRKIKQSNDFNVNSDFLESMAFAWLAYKRVHQEEVNLSSVTGAKKNSILGGIYG